MYISGEIQAFKYLVYVEMTQKEYRIFQDSRNTDKE
jgi:hypothetical protein